MNENIEKGIKNITREIIDSKKDSKRLACQLAIKNNPSEQMVVEWSQFKISQRYLHMSLTN